MRTTPFVLAMMLMGAPVAAAAGAPLEIDLLEDYLATADAAPGMPHCARHNGYALVPGHGPVPLPGGGTNRLLNEHVEFHVQMADGPSDFAPSPADDDRYGEIFLEWHEYYVGLYQRWRAENGHAPLQGWDPATPMPPELAYPYPERGCSGGRDDDPRVALPTWATLAGGDEPDPIFGHTRLCDFEDVNQFGKSMTAGWHRAWHGAVGGDMHALQGPRDPAFWATHQFLIDLTEVWWAACAGATSENAPLAAAAETGAREVSMPGFALLVLGSLGAALAAGRARRS